MAPVVLELLRTAPTTAVELAVAEVLIPLAVAPPATADVAKRDVLDDVELVVATSAAHCVKELLFAAV